MILTLKYLNLFKRAPNEKGGKFHVKVIRLGPVSILLEQTPFQKGLGVQEGKQEEGKFLVCYVAFNII